MNAENRPRARDIGIVTGIFPPGKHNAITDVDGVLVGHASVIHGEGRLVPGQGPARTGVTVILPHGGNVYEDKVPGACYAFNAFGKALGLAQVNEVGAIETPIALTNTLSVPDVANALIDHAIFHNPGIGIGGPTVNPVVGEVNDGRLNDIQGRHVKSEHVSQAIYAARPGPVDEGSVGAGMGCVAFGWKGGIGTASRMVPRSQGGHTVGALVQTNFSGVLMVNGVPVGRGLGRYAFMDDVSEPPTDSAGSVMVVIATDARVCSRNLHRMAKRAVLGLARTGFYGSNGSGDFVIAFSTAYRIADRCGQSGDTLGNESMSAIFLASVEAVEEAVLNSIFRATTVVGRDGNSAEAIDLEKLCALLGRTLHQVQNHSFL